MKTEMDRCEKHNRLYLRGSRCQTCADIEAGIERPWQIEDESDEVKPFLDKIKTRKCPNCGHRMVWG